tara:strand:- start:2342 stop:2476 length:135 start_codon:yes stop_codon:yes gene_type:complete
LNSPDGSESNRSFITGKTPNVHMEIPYKNFGDFAMPFTIFAEIE